jgi:hypothetical protein
MIVWNADRVKRRRVIDRVRRLIACELVGRRALVVAVVATVGEKQNGEGSL